MASKKRNAGFKKIAGQKGKLHRALGVPEGQKIPATKMAAAKRSDNPDIRQMAARATGVLAKGQRTAAKNRAKRKRAVRKTNNSAQLYNMAFKKGR